MLCMLFLTVALIIPSRKRSKYSRGLLLYEGYTYSIRNLKKSGTYWTCSSHHKKGCKAKLTTIDTNNTTKVIEIWTIHNHPRPDVRVPSEMIILN